jgi:hypothetical protein
MWITESDVKTWLITLLLMGVAVGIFVALLIMWLMT